MLSFLSRIIGQAAPVAPVRVTCYRGCRAGWQPVTTAATPARAARMLELCQRIHPERLYRVTPAA
jgi:hypothetical protein